MLSKLPNLYFRVRDNGAFIFRLIRDERMRNVGMEQVGVVNIRNEEIKIQGDKTFTDEEMDDIRRWMKTRQAMVAERQKDDIRRTVESLNLASHWIQSKASDEDLEEIADDLLLAMHDLRTVLVRKQADALAKKDR